MTSYAVVFERFKRRVESDRRFFNYLNISPETAGEIVEQRCHGLLDEAVVLFELKCVPQVDLFDRDEEQFAEDLNEQEIYILASLMFQQYLDREVAKIKSYEVNYTPTNLRVFDPSNARSSFLELYESVCKQNDVLIDAYASRSRNDGGYVAIDYAAYAEDE